MSNLYVGNLAYAVSNEDLKSLFEEFGTIRSAKVIIDRDTKRSKGFGFVEFENDEDAQAAIDELDGAEFEGRTLKVNIARPREEKASRKKEFNRR